jgi:multidrug efflux pump subunit AcrA (membrane-fusion protein)
MPGSSQIFEAQVSGLSPSVDPMLGTASGELSMSVVNEKLLTPGLVGRVLFKVNQREGILLPENAVVYKGDKTFVRVIAADTTAMRVPVRVGDKRQGLIEILSGIKAGDQVVDRASGFVADGDKVKVETTHD